MALIKSVRGYTPEIGKECWLAENATIVGEVIMGAQCTVWFNAVIRGDVNYIKIGDRTNIQDNVTIHGTFEKAPTNIGSDVSIGHNAIVHGCTVQDQVLIGMGAMVMDGAVIKTGAIVAAGAVVLEGTIVEENSIYAGVPARKVKDVEGKNREMLLRIAGNYIKYANWFKNE
ncbi:gamma carbonic anhydrase family protein [Marinoscillum sp. 108]|uniref:Gamma carbonic anhydrase family protein n=1 Tax=Marinoscillum luteum TaxID=861051 RepID=A0ABW7N2V9_9BACT|nr:gamma carbonic anhydrase family protein [Marinoscillum sp. 108]VXD12498.1 Gamma carbonic anhydrase family protein [Marinoscillum sp. 108]